ncbi:hypothetical protein BGZ61DRAFT_472428 [Ilyonectria robusta]|uniref:uncharacterized protein n=1 Tax=Ilyonectria robusta TaxID=1079257 RepID=UPI001E8E9321|nr:uncharacterized protein BGZ61DRAFT_472428 [Ilyonectria robusta]KAH8736061.1 hypothetical protein BGZ61DRAFT_472428 [Ilyonectria robusta]
MGPPSTYTASWTWRTNAVAVRQGGLMEATQTTRRTRLQFQHGNEQIRRRPRRRRKRKKGLAVDQRASSRLMGDLAWLGSRLGNGNTKTQAHREKQAPVPEHAERHLAWPPRKPHSKNPWLAFAGILILTSVSVPVPPRRRSTIHTSTLPHFHLQAFHAAVTPNPAAQRRPQSRDGQIRDPRCQVCRGHPVRGGERAWPNCLLSHSLLSPTPPLPHPPRDNNGGSAAPSHPIPTPSPSIQQGNI